MKYKYRLYSKSLIPLGIIGSTFGTPALSQTVGLDELQVCMAIESQSQRLSCFENLVQNAQTQAITAPMPAPESSAPSITAPKVPSVASPPTPAAPSAAPITSSTSGAKSLVDDQFGLPEKPVRKPVEDQSRSMVLASADKNHKGRWAFTMENGQLWLQTDSAQIPPPAAGTTVHIEEGLWGSFKMRIAKRTVRVKRQK